MSTNEFRVVFDSSMKEKDQFILRPQETRFPFSGSGAVTVSGMPDMRVGDRLFVEGRTTLLRLFPFSGCRKERGRPLHVPICCAEAWLKQVNMRAVCLNLMGFLWLGLPSATRGRQASEWMNQAP